MSNPYGMQLPQKQGQPVWLWNLIASSCLAVVAMIIVLLVDFGGAEGSGDASPIAQGGNANTPNSAGQKNTASTDTTAQHSPLLIKLIAAGNEPYSLSRTVPPDVGWMRNSVFCFDNSDRFFNWNIDREGGLSNFYSEEWDLQSQSLVRQYEPNIQQEHFTPKTMSPDGLWFGGLSYSSIIRAANTQTGELKDLLADTADLVYLAFTADSSALIALHSQQVLVTIDIKSGQKRFEHEVPNASSIAVFSPLPFTKNVIYFAADEEERLSEYYVVNHETGEVENHVECNLGASVSEFVVLPDGSGVIIGDHKGPTVLVEIATGNILHSWPEGWTPHRLLPGGDVVLLTDDTGQVSLVNLHNFETIATWMAHAEPGKILTHTVHGTSSAASSRDGSTMATFGVDDTVRFWSLTQ